MDLKISKKAEVKIDIKELTNIISDYIKNKEELRGYTITELTDYTRTEEISGRDIHDCDYIEHFDGIKISLTK